ncbi:MAG: RNA polymerase sigma factor [bacterium]
MTEPSDIRTDWDLARQAAGGCEEAWRAIYERTADKLFAFLCYQSGNREDALDLMQETYLQAQRRLESYRGEAPLGSWLRTIALRKSLDWRRRVLSPMRRTLELTENTAIVEEESDVVQFHSEKAALHRALKTLSPQQRAALLLREWDGLSFREIASMIGCQENTARVHHTRAREKMRDRMKDAFANDPEALSTERLNEQRI